jgi:hypothetical protein
MLHLPKALVEDTHFEAAGHDAEPFGLSWPQDFARQSLDGCLADSEIGTV